MHDESLPLTLTCEVHREGDTITARFVGELDIATANQAHDVLREAVQGQGERLVLDLRELTFIDSSGLRLLLRWDAESRSDGFRMELVHGPGHVQRLLELTGLQSHFRSPEPPG